jgi:ABC-2 type transport system permease protein
MRAIYLIARREFLSYVATWGFWLSLASVPLFMAVGIGLPILIESSQPTRYYALIDETGGELEAAINAGMSSARAEQMDRAIEAAEAMIGENPQVRAAMEEQLETGGDERYVRIDPGVTTLDELRPLLLGERQIETIEGPQPLFAAIFLRRSDADGIEIEYWSTNLTDGNLRGDIQRAIRTHMRLTRLIDAGVPVELIDSANALEPIVRQLNPERVEAAEVTEAERIPVFVGAGVAFMLWIIVFSVVNMLLTAMIEEKGNKVLEMMLASSRHHEILIGKLLGVAAVSATLLVFWGGLSMGAGVVTQQVTATAGLPIADILAAVLDPGLLVPAFGYFVIGYLMYGAIFLAIGSLCETIHDAQTLMSPLMLVMMVPLFLIMMAFESPDSPILVIASWVPVWTPFIMLARLPQDPGMFDMLGTTSVMLVTAAVVLWGAGRMFRMGALNQANQDTVKAWFSFGGKRKSA